MHRHGVSRASAASGEFTLAAMAADVSIAARRERPMHITLNPG